MEPEQFEDLGITAVQRGRFKTVILRFEVAARKSNDDNGEAQVRRIHSSAQGTYVYAMKLKFSQLR